MALVRPATRSSRPRSPRATSSPRARWSTSPATASCRRRWTGASRTSPTSRRPRRTCRSASSTRARRIRAPVAQRQARDVHRRRLPRLPVDVRHRRRVHGVPGGRARPVRGDQEPPERAARGLRRPQRQLGQGRARDRHRRLGLLRRQHRPGQHRRVGQVPVARSRWSGAGRATTASATPLRLLAARAALRHRQARRRQGRLARGPRQRRARRAWARRSSTTPST